MVSQKMGQVFWHEESYYFLEGYVIRESNIKNLELS